MTDCNAELNRFNYSCTEKYMTEIYRFIFEKLTDPLSLPIAWYWEYLIIYIIDRISYLFAFRKVGSLYSSGDISGKGAGSFLHWVIRLGYFVAIWALIRIAIPIIKICIANWLLILAMTFVFALIVYTMDSLQKELNSNA